MSVQVGTTIWPLLTEMNFTTNEIGVHFMVFMS